MVLYIPGGDRRISEPSMVCGATLPPAMEGYNWFFQKMVFFMRKCVSESKGPKIHWFSTNWTGWVFGGSASCWDKLNDQWFIPRKALVVFCFATASALPMSSEGRSFNVCVLLEDMVKSQNRKKLHHRKLTWIPQLKGDTFSRPF